MPDLPIPFSSLQALCQQESLHALATCTATGPNDARYMQQLLDDGVGDMHYLANQFELRRDPVHLLPDYTCILACALPYQHQREDQGLKRARYAAGKDYHKIFRKKLAAVGYRLNQRAQPPSPPYLSRACVDSAPLNERSLAQRAGLGWLGKNALLIHPQRGSYHFLGFLLTTAPLEIMHGQASDDRCGSCTSCEVQCPTQALVGRRVLSERCISYLTIEHHGVIPKDLARNFQGWWYGCDICQEACPWNKFAVEAGDKRFLGQDSEAEVLALRETNFTQFTAGRAIGRISYAQFRRNLLVALWSLQRESDYQQFDDEDIDVVKAQARELGICR